MKAQEEAAALREGSSDLASLQVQLAAAQEEASGLRNNSEEVEYLQAQLRRTLRQVVELQRQVGHTPQCCSPEAFGAANVLVCSIHPAAVVSCRFMVIHHCWFFPAGPTAATGAFL